MARKARSNTKLVRRGRRFELRQYPFPDHFGSWLGYEITDVNTRTHRAEAELKIRENHLSPAKRVHGGVVAAFFDVGCAAAVFSSMEPTDFCSTVELKVNFLKPLDLGDHLTIKSELVYNGARLRVAHARMYRRGDRPPVGVATATFNVVRTAAREESRKPKARGRKV